MFKSIILVSALLASAGVMANGTSISGGGNQTISTSVTDTTAHSWGSRSGNAITNINASEVLSGTTTHERTNVNTNSNYDSNSISNTVGGYTRTGQSINVGALSASIGTVDGGSTGTFSSEYFSEGKAVGIYSGSSTIGFGVVVDGVESTAITGYDGTLNEFTRVDSAVTNGVTTDTYGTQYVNMSVSYAK